MPNPISYIGGTVAVSAAAPATYNSAGYAALSWTTVGGVTEWGETGDTSEDVTVTELTGRVFHVNGALDGGAVPFTIRSDTDAGQTIILNNANSNTDISIRITDPDGKIEYATGRLANVRSRARTASAWKGFTGQFRVNSAVVKV